MAGVLTVLAIVGGLSLFEKRREANRRKQNPLWERSQGTNVKAREHGKSLGTRNLAAIPTPVAAVPIVLAAAFIGAKVCKALKGFTEDGKKPIEMEKLESEVREHSEITCNGTNGPQSSPGENGTTAGAEAANGGHKDQVSTSGQATSSPSTPQPILKQLRNTSSGFGIVTHNPAVEAFHSPYNTAPSSPMLHSPMEHHELDFHDAGEFEFEADGSVYNEEPSSIHTPLTQEERAMTAMDVAKNLQFDDAAPAGAAAEGRAESSNLSTLSEVDNNNEGGGELLDDIDEDEENSHMSPEVKALLLRAKAASQRVNKMHASILEMVNSKDK